MSQRRRNSRNRTTLALATFFLGGTLHARASLLPTNLGRFRTPRPSSQRAAPALSPPERGTPRRGAVAHTAGVTTFDSETAPTTTQSAAPISEGAADTSAPQHERQRQQLRASRTATVHASMLEQSTRDLLVVSAQLIEAACRARDGDSDGTRAHIAFLQRGCWR